MNVSIKRKLAKALRQNSTGCNEWTTIVEKEQEALKKELQALVF